MQAVGLDAIIPETLVGRADKMAILAVDDNLAHCYALSRVLRASGFEVVEAHTGSAALSFAADHCPEIVLLDIHLPDVSGYEILKTLRQNDSTRNIGIIVHTATESISAGKRHAESLGADAYLTYPIEPEYLVAVVHGTLSRVLERSLNDPVSAPTPDGQITILTKCIEVLRNSLASPFIKAELAESIRESLAHVEMDLRRIKTARKPN